MGFYGWNGRVLEVDLTRGKIDCRDLDEKVLLEYLGGRGLGVRLVAERGVGIDPFHPDNPLVFSVGPLTATPVPTANRFSLVSRSPLTGTIFDANSGGRFGVSLKRCMVDALVITGRSPRPVYLFLSGGKAEIKEASHLWGKGVMETTHLLLEHEESHASVACIGRAGERLLPLAGVMNDFHRASARGGLGAVMGSKNLKAVVADGHGEVRVADKARLGYVIKEAQRWIKANPVTSQGLPYYGTAILVNLINELGAFPSFNFQKSSFDGAEKLSGETLSETILQHRKACWGCSIGCARVTEARGKRGEGPEYESIWALGAQCGVEDLETVAEANYICNDAGLDTISTGSTIGCAMELRQRGLWPEGPAFGNRSHLVRAVGEIVSGEGWGPELAQGSRKLASGRGAGHLAMQVKGLELPAYDPRGLQGQGLGFATSNRGGCHLRAYLVAPEVLGIPKLVDRFTTRDKPGLTIFYQNINAAVDSLALCRFLQFSLSEDYFARMLSAVTGKVFRAHDLHLVGERIWNLEKSFNLACGIGAEEDTLPPRLLEEEVREGPARGQVVHLGEMLPLYYRARGWSWDGVPLREKVKMLNVPTFT
jgi:aldehyde:ferredoxin oxidoreductase